MMSKFVELQDKQNAMAQELAACLGTSPWDTATYEFCSQSQAGVIRRSRKRLFRGAITDDETTVSTALITLSTQLHTLMGETNPPETANFQTLICQFTRNGGEVEFNIEFVYPT